MANEKAIKLNVFKLFWYIGFRRKPKGKAFPIINKAPNIEITLISKRNPINNTLIIWMNEKPEKRLGLKMYKLIREKAKKTNTISNRIAKTEYTLAL